MRTLNVALVQTALHWHDPAANRALFDGLIADVDPAVDLIVLPEMLSTGFTMASAEVAETMDGETVAWLRELAAKRGATVAGSMVINDAGRCYNRLVWMPADGRETVYDKRHLFRMAGEHDHYSAGESRVNVQLGDWRIRLSVCYDLRFPVWLRSRGDYDALLCVANWPAARQTAWSTLLRARAVENLCYTIAVNRIGRDGNGVDYRGGSGVYGPEGEALAEVFDREAVVRVALDLDELDAYRQQFPAWRDADSFKIAL